ncbi:unnamed protein product [Lampetra planeri]
MEHEPDIRCNMDDEETAVMRGMDSNVMWHSSGIVQRLSARQLKTKSGAIYSLKGPPNFHNRGSSAPCTRSGRRVRPPLDYWRGEHLITDPKTGKVHVTAGGHDYLLSHTIITPTCKYLVSVCVSMRQVQPCKELRCCGVGTTKGSHKHQPIVPKPTARRLTEVKLALDALLQDLSSANQTESHTEQTESHTEQTESHTEQTESHTEQTERGSLGGAGPTGGEVARMDHNRLKLVPYISLKRILPDTLGAIQNLPSPPDAQTLESPEPRENQVALQHSSRKRTLTFQDPTELLTELQECTEAIDEEESASESIVRKAKRPRRTTSGPTVSTAATPTKEVGAQSERQRVESERHSPSRPASEKPCQKPRNHEAMGNERDLGWPQSSSSSSDECLSRSKRLRTRSERKALHLSDLPLNTAADFIFSAITESEYNLHLRYAEGDHDLSD